eukprot:364035_1
MDVGHYEEADKYLLVSIRRKPDCFNTMNLMNKNKEFLNKKNTTEIIGKDEMLVKRFEKALSQMVDENNKKNQQIEKLSNSIILLQSNFEKLRQENEQLRKFNECKRNDENKEGYDDLVPVVTSLQDKVKILEEKVKRLEDENELNKPTEFI